MEKNSFTLFETLISISLLAIVISNFSYITKTKKFDKEFILLNSLSNDFNIKDYTKLNKSQEILNIRINELTHSTITVDKFLYEDENIKIYKYEK